MTLTPERIAVYVRRRRADLDRLRIALQQKNMEEFHRVGHQLRGNSPTFGFDELVPIGERLELLTAPLLLTEGDSVLRAFEQWILRQEQFHQ